jgi:hypothetical protein
MNLHLEYANSAATIFIPVEALNSVTSFLEDLKQLLPQDAATAEALSAFIYESKIAADPAGMLADVE